MVESVNPTEFQLVSAYPNPFNPIINIEFNVQEKDEVSIQVFDLNGNLVKIITQSTFNEGTYSLTWSGKNNEGLLVSSGIYFIQAIQSGKIEKKKILFLK
jgi:flagellar hook assembly protein FlgD